MTSNRSSEVITLQFGHYSNFIGTHWWNCQEASFDYNSEIISDINHDVFFREGLNHRNEITFTPRMLLVDLKGSVGHLNNDLYEDVCEESDIAKAISTWPSDKIERIQSTICSMSTSNDFQEDMKSMEEGKEVQDIDIKNYDLDDSVKLWSDYMRMRYHPRSINLLEQYQHGNAAQPFNCFLQGTEVWKCESMCEDWTDKVRAFVEESDCLQGFQIISDTTDGFGGLCASGLQYLKDEYSSKASFVFPVIPPRDASSNYKLRNVNSALLISSLIEHADMFSPLSISSDCWNQFETYRQFPLLEYNESLPYHSTSVLSSLLDTISLSYRLRGSTGLRMSDLSTLLTPVGRKAVVSSVRMPWPMKHAQSLLECLEHWEGPLSFSLTPYSTVDNVSLQAINLRGVHKKKMFPRDMSNKECSSNPAYNCSSVRDMLQYFLSCDLPRTAHYVYCSSEAIKTINPFPNIFSSQISSHGCIPGSNMNETSNRVQHIPVLGGLHNCPSVGSMLSTLHDQAKSINVKSIPSLLSLDKTEWSEILESLLSLRDDYNENSCI